MDRRILAGAVIVGSLWGTGGCVTPGRDPQVVLLPLHPQSSARFQCGPTTLASVLAFHGSPVAEETISAALYSPTARGVLITDLAWYARSHGFQTELRTGRLSDLQAAVAGRQPPIVLLDLGIAGLHQPHFTAVTGWSDAGIHYLGTETAGEFVTKETFERQWQRAGNQLLVLTRSP
jgi:predicted double-glycine peptidase